MKKRTALEGAEEKGRAAARAGLPFSSCPYSDKRNTSGKLSWSRAFMNAWKMGWWSERMEMGLPPH